MSVPRCKVMLFTDNFKMGGTERFLIRLATHLNRSRFSVSFGCFSQAGEFRERVPNDVAVYEFALTHGLVHPGGVQLMARLVKHLRRQRTDVFLTAHNYTNVRAGFAARLARVPLVTGQRGQLVPNRRRDRIASGLADWWAARVIANSQAIAAETLAREPISPAKVVVIPNGAPPVDFDALLAKREATREYYGIPPEATLITCLARISPEKGQQVLIESLALLKARGFAPTLLLAGGGDIGGMRELAARLGVLEQLRTPGMVSDTAILLAASDLFVLPSLTESFPNALVEAMQVGLPCVASDVGGVCEVLETELSGLAVKPGDPKMLGDALQRLLSDPDLAGRLGATAQRVIASEYSLAKMIERIEAVLIQAAGGR